jgi:hypothetical protein
MLRLIRSPNLSRKPLSEVGLRQAIDRIVEKGFIREATHSEIARADRNISDEDIRFGLERKEWSLAKPPDFDDKHKNYEYLIKTADIEGEELHLKIVVYPDENRLKIITKY